MPPEVATEDVDRPRADEIDRALGEDDNMLLARGVIAR